MNIYIAFLIGTTFVIKSVDNLDFHLNSTLKDIIPELKGVIKKILQ